MEGELETRDELVFRKVLASCVERASLLPTCSYGREYFAERSGDCETQAQQLAARRDAR